VNVNDDGNLKANVNRFSNDNVWNGSYLHRVVVPKLTVLPLYLAGVLLNRPFLHPPSIRPISASFSESSEYFSVFISLCSQAICVKNFKESNLEIVLPNKGIFSVGAR
jgi:hypothetical protein